MCERPARVCACPLQSWLKASPTARRRPRPPLQGRAPSMGVFARRDSFHREAPALPSTSACRLPSGWLGVLTEGLLNPSLAELGPVWIHLELITAAVRLIIAS